MSQATALFNTLPQVMISLSDCDKVRAVRVIGSELVHGTAARLFTEPKKQKAD
jgi:hypothetical protein